MEKLSVYVILIVSLNTPWTEATYDLNFKELQMVADHLTTDECRRLSEGLHQTEFFLRAPLTGKDEPDLPCIDLLLHWDSHEGRGKSFNYLAIRLKEIDRYDLAGKLSRYVYKEKADAVKKTFLGHPFRKYIGKGSTVLEESPLVEKPELTDED